MIDNPPSMSPGERIGPYLLIRPLGKGGMGEVFAAVHERMGQAVALKLLTRLDPACAARFIQEARALSQLDHPGVVRVLFLGETDDGVPYLVLEQVAGRSLREHLHQHPDGLPRAQALPLLSQAAAAMDAVHRRGIVHRDLKPDNILLASRPGAPDTVKIIDFGIARVPPPAGDLPGQDTLVETGDQGPRWLGTIAYMAPEQCQRGAEIGPAADVYALGVVLYEVLLGQPPFRASDPVELAAMHLRAAPDLTALGPGALQRLAGAMLTKDPAARPSMAEVAAALAELAAPGSEPVPVPGPGPMIDGGRRALSGGLLVVAGALLLAGAGPRGRALLRRVLAGAVKKSAPPAIAGPEKGVSPLQMQQVRPSGLILIAHMEQGTVPQSEMLAALPPAYRTLPRECVAPVTGAAESADFPAAGAALLSWSRETLLPLLSRHPDFLVVYFGVAPIPLITYLGWLLGPLHPVEVRLRHHGERRFLPWAEAPGTARPLPPRWGRERDAAAGEVVVRLSTSHLVNEAAARAAVPAALCEVDLRLPAPAEDVFRSEAEVMAVADAWKAVLDEITERFPRARRVHLFASVQAGVALLLGTRVSQTMHPPIMTYHYRAGAYLPGLVINDQDERPTARERGPMDFQTLFSKFHETIKLKDTDENADLRRRRDEVLEHLRGHMWERHRLKFQPFNSGSYAMGTGVQPLRGADIDIDVGVMFALEHAQQDARALKEWVFRGLPTSLGRIEWRRPCITVFRRDHHLDLGIYAEDRGGLWLAMGKATDPAVTWQQDGIRLFIDDVRGRFPNSRGDHDQFQRTIRYLKRWKDVNFQGDGVKAPVGLALTVMAYHWFSPRSRSGVYKDLAALSDLVRRVLEHFSGDRVDLKFPRAPGDNLLRKLSAEQVRQMRGRFQGLLKLLEEAASKASTAPLRRAFGEDFPEG